MRTKTLLMIGAGLTMCASALALAPSSRSAAATDGATLEVTLGEPLLAEGERTTPVRVALTAPGEAAWAAPSVMALAIDVSGSMHGAKIENARRAAHRLVDRMGPDDRMAIVTFSGAGDLGLPSAPATADRALLHATLDRLSTVGGTCIECGLAAAFEALAQAGPGRRRVILLSDGAANQGTVGVELGSFAERHRMDATVSSVGLGADFDEVTMSAIARATGGAFYFVHNSSVIEEVLDRELVGLGSTVATRAHLLVQVLGDARWEAGPGWALSANGRELRVDLGALGGEETRAIVLPLRVASGSPAVRAVLETHSSSGIRTTSSPFVQFERVHDAARALAARDPAIVEEAERVRSANTVDRAAARFLAGSAVQAVTALRAEARRLRAAGTDMPRLAREADAIEEVAESLEGRDPSDRVAVGSALFERARAQEVQRGVEELYHQRGMYDMEAIE